MSGHAQIGDLEQIREARTQERMEAMGQRRHRERLELWPTSCPSCFAEPGEPCMSRTGKRYGGRHTTRGAA